MLQAIAMLIGAGVGAFLGTLAFRRLGLQGKGIASLDLGPGDQVLVQLDHDPPEDCVVRIAEQLKEAVPDNKLIVVGRGVELSVVRPDDGAEGER
ncbi:MAG TPA: hypothetical protein VI039_12815 [Solirubrobacterales bacterium]